MVRIIANAKHYNLIETFLETIAEECLKNTMVKTITIAGFKPEVANGSEKVGAQLKISR